MEIIDKAFWTKQVKDQYNYLDKLKSQKHTMHPDRFTMLWSSACNQLDYFIKKSEEK